MKIYYEDDLTKIIHGDCREIISEFKGAAVITDPPFNIGYKYKSYKDKVSLLEYESLLRITCSQPSVVIHYPENICSLSLILGVPPEKVVAWVYHSNTGRQWRSVAWFGIKPDFKKCGQPYKNPNDKRVKKLIESGKQCRLYDWWHVNQVKNVSHEKTPHPCQMPAEVMKRIISITECNLILDPFLGSGTTLVAAKMLGRKSIGIELDESYCEIAAKRIQKTTL